MKLANSEGILIRAMRACASQQVYMWFHETSHGDRVFQSYSLMFGAWSEGGWQKRRKDGKMVVSNYNAGCGRSMLGKVGSQISCTATPAWPKGPWPVPSRCNINIPCFLFPTFYSRNAAQFVRVKLCCLDLEKNIMVKP